MFWIWNVDLDVNLIKYGESLSEKHDFGDESVFWNHHAHWTEKDFKIVWKLRSPGVAWVHGDEHSNRAF